MSIPTLYEPVKVIPPTSGCFHSASPDDQMERPGGHAAVAVALVELVSEQRSLVRRLEDHAVARDQRAGGGPSGERHREVERADHGPHAVRAHHVVVVAGCAETAHRGPEPDVR